ncbi:MAG: ABC transporter permease, partial [Candidatus Thorarchaeota archaeon]
MGLREYVIRRTIYVFLLIVAVICFNFFIFRLPTFLFGVSPLDLMIAPEQRATMPYESLQLLYQNYGLVPDPDIFDWIYMFWRYIVNMFSGDFGFSFQSQRPVIDEIMARLPNTLLLMGTSSIVAIILGIWTGVKAAADPGSRKDVGAVTMALFTFSLPIFWLGMVLLFFFAYMLPAMTSTLIEGGIGLPSGGTISYEVWIVFKDQPFGALAIAGDILLHLLLPMIALGIGGYGGY